jgi:P pilus assembly protein, chaperone PapD
MQVLRLIRYFVSVPIGLVLVLCSQVALASGLQISPISLEMPANQKSGEVWLRNAGADVVHAQVRVYRWSQDKGEDVLTPDNFMIASPPMVQVASGQQQLVRLVRIGSMAGPAANERTYRLLIDELPIKKPGTKVGLDFVFRYSIPVFIAGTAPARPVLDWSVQQAGQRAWLLVKNTGTSRGQMANITFTPVHGKAVTVIDGLAGYVLPGQYRRLQLSVSPTVFAHGGTFNSLINGVKTDMRVGPITKAP